MMAKRICFVLFLAAIAGCGKRDTQASALRGEQESRGAATAPASAPTPAAVYVIGNDRGMLRPCGCSKPKLGGIDRRLAFFKALPEAKRARSAIVAAGSLVTTGGRQQELKLESFVQALSALGVGAFVPTDLDLQVGTSWWRSTGMQLATFPLVSTNLEWRGERLFASHAVVKVDGVEVVVVGYVAPQGNALNEPDVLAVEAPDVRPIILALGEGGVRRTLLVFTTAAPKVAKAWIESSGLAGAAARVAIAHTGPADLPMLDHLGAMPILDVGQKGRNVAEWSWPGLDRLDRHVLDDAAGSDPMGKDLLQLYRDAVGFEDLLQRVPKIGHVPGEFAGDASCKTCHPTADDVWRKSSHARAWATLVESGDTADPECVRCHVVAFGVEGGFDAAAKTPVNVQCEACHGPSKDHVENLTPVPRGKPEAPFCVTCHDIENSPHFEFAPYWEKIKHGREPK